LPRTSRRAAASTPGRLGSAICDPVCTSSGRRQLDAAEAGEVLDSFPDAGGSLDAFIANGDTLSSTIHDLRDLRAVGDDG